MPLLTTAGLVLAGAFYWTLLEYLLHRFAFHHHPKRFGPRHFQHHADVTRPHLAIAPPLSFAGGALLHLALFWLALGPALGLPLFAGFFGADVGYEVVHYRIHFSRMRTRWGEALRAHHLRHHDGSPFSHYGVTSPLWDHVFGTFESRPPRRRR
ncbi:MAG: sterol desaturase family protein [Myxococcales bacterium]